MSMKENVDFVKQELSSEDKLFEGSVKAERFFKKYKVLMISVVSLAIIFAIAYNVKSYMDEENMLKANQAFEKVLNNPKDEASLAVLKDTNKNLYEIALYLDAKKEGKSSDINVKFLKELALYQEALKNKSIAELNTLSMENDFLLKEFAIFNKALILATEGKYEDAKASLKLIPNTSKAYELSNLLNHYLLTK